MSNDLIEFCRYVQPIVSGCAGFIRTSGYMYHQPGVIVMMSADETYLSIIYIPLIFDIKITAIIGDFIKIDLKNPDECLDVRNKTYFLGYNIKQAHLMKYLSDYCTIDNWDRCVYQEDDCYNINGFENSISSSEISSIKVLDGNKLFQIPSSKAITNIAKADSCSIKIYDYLYDPKNSNIKTVKFTVFKKKFKLNIDIFTNILSLNREAQI